MSYRTFEPAEGERIVSAEPGDYRRCEYRVSWKREGNPWRYQIVQTESAARVLSVTLKTGDLHYRCDESHGDCLLPLVEGPIVKARDVGVWRVVDV